MRNELETVWAVPDALWERLDIFDKLWALLIYHCEELQSLHWEWRTADGMLNKARFIGDGQKGG